MEMKFNQIGAALRVAKETIKINHGAEAWEIYDKHSPEMKAINLAIENISTVKSEYQKTLASQQLTGFASGHDSDNIIELIESMGLKRDEWEEIKGECESFGLMSRHIDEVNEYFHQQ